MMTVGSYEAKTRLPALLDEVARGGMVTITRYGMLAAVLRPVDEFERMSVDEAIDRLTELGKGKSLGGLTIRELIEEGRRY